MKLRSVYFFYRATFRYSTKLVLFFVILYVFFVCPFASNIAQAQQLSISPSAMASVYEEALTANSEAGESLFYNPAGLAWEQIKVNLASVDALADQQSSNDIQKSAKNIDTSVENQLNKFLSYSGLRQGKALLKALDVQVPFIGFQSFANIELQSVKTSTKLNSELKFKVGEIAGFGFRWKHFSIGMSGYVFNQAQLNFHPSDGDLAQLESAYQQNTLNTELLTNASKYSEVYYGQAFGKNFGFLYKFSDDSESGVGLALLNAGKTKFTKESKISQSRTKKMETDMTAEAGKYALTLNTPSDLPEIKNVGYYFASSKKSLLHSSFWLCSK